MYVLPATNNTLKTINMKAFAGKNNNVFAQTVAPSFEGMRYDYLVKTGKNIQKTPLVKRLLTQLKTFISGLIKKLPHIAKNTSDDVARSSALKGVTTPVIKFAKKAGAYCVAAVTAAVIFVRNIGDDIKLRMRAKVKPVGLIKDVGKKVSSQIQLMNSANYASTQRLHGPGVTDIAGKVTDGISQSIGVNVKDSAKHLIWGRVQSLFTSN